MVEEEKNKKDDESVTLIKEEDNKGKMVKWLAVVGVIFFIIVLIVVRYQVEDFPILYVLVIGGTIILVGIILYFSAEIFRKIQKLKTKESKEEELPKVATEKMLKDRIVEVIGSPEYRNHIKKWLNIKRWVVNKNIIYDFEIQPLYNEKTANDIIHVIINSHYIDEMPTVLYNPSGMEIKSCINVSSLSPSPEADQEHTEIFNPITNTIVKSHKKRYKRLNEFKVPKSEDLA